MIRSLDRQNVLDVALQYCGDIDVAFDLAAQNDMAITDEIPAGTTYKEPEIINNGIVTRYAALRIMPATDLSAVDGEQLEYGGIGLMGIDINFMIQ